MDITSTEPASGSTLSASSKRSRAFELLLREARNLIRDEDPGPFTSPGASAQPAENSASAILPSADSQGRHILLEQSSQIHAAPADLEAKSTHFSEIASPTHLPCAGGIPEPCAGGIPETCTEGSSPSPTAASEENTPSTSTSGSPTDLTSEQKEEPLILTAPTGPLPSHPPLSSENKKEGHPIEKGKKTGQLVRPSCVLGTVPADGFPALAPIDPSGDTPLCRPLDPTISRQPKRPETANSSAPPGGAASAASKPAQGVWNSVPQYDTVLYRPVGRQTTFRQASQEAISAFLATLEGVERVRVNFLRNVAAVDVPAGAAIDSLLTIAEICGVAVRAQQASKTRAVGQSTMLIPPSMNWKSETTFRRVSQFSNVPARSQTSLCASPAKRHRRTLSYSSNVAAFAPDARAQPNVTTVADTVTLASHALMNHAVYVAVVPTPVPGAQPRLPNVFTAAAPIQPLNHAAPDGKKSVDSSRCALRRLCPYREARHSPLRAPPPGVPTPPGTCTSDKQDSIIAVLAAALKSAMDFLPTGCPIRPLCAAALATHLALIDDDEC
ncbi:uncharacterized protein LOC119391867 [Rhipicephalus sanguineus]|uniref:uncharacterized protein LOC119391867 n=1 Tax=Rhipicephalus sanguineus TaxID=34632 RepID=UPI0020C3548D|nr:uncharacterized protein LOC119391867 [Rhipicephalus sanguineus]